MHSSGNRWATNQTLIAPGEEAGRLRRILTAGRAASPKWLPEKRSPRSHIRIHIPPAAEPSNGHAMIQSDQGQGSWDAAGGQPGRDGAVRAHDAKRGDWGFPETTTRLGGALVEDLAAGSKTLRVRFERE